MTTNKVRNIVEDGSRWWVVESHDYSISVDGVDAAEYCGLADEDAGGIVAWGTFANMSRLANALNNIELEVAV